MKQAPKRALSVVLAFCLVLTMFTGLISTQAASPFPDLSTSHWAYDVIVGMYNMGFVKGDNKGNVKPESYVTTTEFMALINRMFGLYLTTSTNYADTAGHWGNNENVFSYAAAQGYIIAETGRQGVRPRKFGGRLPWLKDRKAVLGLYDELYALAPQSELAPRLLFRKGVFASEISEEIFEGDRVRDAIGAFEMLIGSHPESPLVPEAYLLLAGIYEKLSPGAEWDQVSTRRALNYYTDFYTLFPEHPQAEYAYGRTEALRMRLAENRLSVGDFYYVRRNNMRAALVFYNEAITHAPESEAADRARERIEKIRRGKRADLTFIDWLFGRYPAPRTTDFADAPSQKSLEEMGFRSADSLERADEGEAAAAEDAAEPRRVFADPAGE